jgi:hypothetical protein
MVNSSMVLQANTRNKKDLSSKYYGFGELVKRNDQNEGKNGETSERDHGDVEENGSREVW